MAFSISAVFCLALFAVSALPNQGPEPITLNQDVNFAEESLKNNDASSRFNPDVDNVYHLFTRANPSVSQPIVLNNNNLLMNSNFDPNKRTAIVVHGFTQSASSPPNVHLVPAFLAAEDMNVFAMDWSAGSLQGAVNVLAAGTSLARTINWIMATTGTTIDRFHLAGFSLGAHLIGIAGRNVNGRIPYLTALDPGANMENSGLIFGPDAGIYTEAIHSNAGLMGHGEPIAHVDFFPNGGDLHPGCGINFLCNHNRAFMFFAESLMTSTGFIGTRCQTLIQARTGLCIGPGSLRMGGITPKTGSTGLFHLTTNAQPPFANDV